MDSDSPPEAANLWQAPTPFVAQQLVSILLRTELRWGLFIAPLRLLSKGWRAAVDGVLPVLAPQCNTPPDEVVALASRFGAGLLMLRLECPSNEALFGKAGTLAREKQAEACIRALPLVVKACPGLISLSLDWTLPAGDHELITEEALLLPLSELHQLRRLCLSVSELKPEKKVGPSRTERKWGFPALPPLPDLVSLRLTCPAAHCAGLAAFTGLTELELTIPNVCWAEVASMVVEEVAQLQQLHRLSLHMSGCNTPPSDLLRLTALTNLTSLGLGWQVADVVVNEVGMEQQEETAAPLLTLLAHLGCGGSGTGRLKQLSLQPSLPERRRQHRAANSLPLQALSALEGLTWLAPNLEATPPPDHFSHPFRSSFIHLARLTALDLNLTRAHQGTMGSEEPSTRAVETIGRRLTGLCRLRLGAYFVKERALVQLSGLTQLTSLYILGYNFGGEALAALLPLTRLVQLSLASHVVSDASLSAVLPVADDWEAAAEAARGAPGATMGGDETTELEAEQIGPPVLPGLTYLCLDQNCLLSGAGLAHLAASMPSLRRLVHRGAPQLEPRHLQHLLQQCSQLQLLQTTWRPSIAPLPLPLLKPLASSSHAGSEGLSEHQVQTAAEQAAVRQAQQERFEAGQAICRNWALNLQHSLEQPQAQRQRGDVIISVYQDDPSSWWEAERALEEAGVAL